MLIPTRSPKAASPAPWAKAEAIKNWKAGSAAARVIGRGPPAGWVPVKYRLASRRGGRASVTWVLEAVEAQQAIAGALGVAETEIVLFGPKPPPEPWEEPLSEAGNPWEVAKLVPPPPREEPEPLIPVRPALNLDAAETRWTA